jgi:hypothetical protein
MIIKKKLDICLFLVHFTDFSEWNGEKHYMIIEDYKYQGTITLMKYWPESFTYHRTNKYFCDIKEIPLDNSFIWNNRKVINKQIKEYMNKRLFEATKL